MIINIRGTNGSGKTTTAKSFKTGRNLVELTTYHTKAFKLRVVPGYADEDVCLIGNYETECGGMDTMPSFAVCFAAIRKAELISKHVICEGILASTVYGSWGEFAEQTDAREKELDRKFAFCYMQTPLEVCLERIQRRNGGKEIKTEQVAAKFKAIAATRKRAMAAGFLVYDLPYEDEKNAVRRILAGEGYEYRAD